MKKSLAALAVAGLMTVPAVADAIPYRAIDHRSNAPAAQADENTLVGVRWDASHKIMSELDFVALGDNTCAAYHYKLWEQGTRNGVGQPIETTGAYVRSLVTKTRGQGVPTCFEALRAIKRNKGTALVEMHYAWTPAHVQYLVNTIRAFGLQRQVYITGTKARLDMLKPLIGPLFKVVFRVKVSKPITKAQLVRYGADITQVRGNESQQRVNWLRANGYPVWGSGPASAFEGLYQLGIHRVQTDGPRAWINFGNKHR